MPGLMQGGCCENQGPSEVEGDVMTSVAYELASSSDVIRLASVKQPRHFKDQ